MIDPPNDDIPPNGSAFGNQINAISNTLQGTSINSSNASSSTNQGNNQPPFNTIQKPSVAATISSPAAVANLLSNISPEVHARIEAFQNSRSRRNNSHTSWNHTSGDGNINNINNANKFRNSNARIISSSETYSNSSYSASSSSYQPVTYKASIPDYSQYNYNKLQQPTVYKSVHSGSNGISYPVAIPPYEQYHQNTSDNSTNSSNLYKPSIHPDSTTSAPQFVGEPPLGSLNKLDSQNQGRENETSNPANTNSTTSPSLSNEKNLGNIDLSTALKLQVQQQMHEQLQSQKISLSKSSLAARRGIKLNMSETGTQTNNEKVSDSQIKIPKQSIKRALPQGGLKLNLSPAESIKVEKPQEEGARSITSNGAGLNQTVLAVPQNINRPNISSPLASISENHASSTTSLIGVNQHLRAPVSSLNRSRPGKGLKLDFPAAQGPENLFSNHSKYIDIKTGSLNFAGKASLHSKGIDFSSGSHFRISLEDLEPLGELGRGNYGTVTKVLHKPTGIIMAMKQIRLELEESKFLQIIMELEVLHKCVSPYIVDFYGAFFVEGAVYLCIEYMDGGSLDKVYQGGVPEPLLAVITESVIHGLKQLKEEHNIIHRDVKPTNILVSTSGKVKLCDFGVSGNLVASIAKTNIGCQSYMAPERISSSNTDDVQTYTAQSDIWSLGLSVLEVAMGCYPYPPETFNTLISQISAILYGDAPTLPKDKFSEEARSFVSQCLNKSPRLRPTYSKLLAHPWLKNRKDRFDEVSVELGKFVQQALERNKAKKKSSNSSSPSGTVSNSTESSSSNIPPLHNGRGSALLPQEL